MFKTKIIVLATTLLMSGVAAADLNAGLVAYYPFNGNADDMSGNNHNGIVNGTQLTVDKLGNPESAYSFNGNGDEIVVSDSPDLNFNTNSPQSISLWVYRTGTEPIMHFIGKRIGCGSDFGNYQFAFNESSGENIVYLRASSNRKLPLKKWIHLVATFDGVIAKIYMNGVFFAKGKTAIGSKNDAPLLIGGSGACSHFKGSIDEIYIYNRALIASEITDLYNQGIPVNGTVKSLGSHTITCANNTTAQSITIPASTATAYDCEAKGLKVNPQDDITITIKGKAQ